MAGPTTLDIATERTLRTLVAREVLQCVSAMVWQIGQNSDAAESLGIVDDLAGLCVRDDWETPVTEHDGYIAGTEADGLITVRYEDTDAEDCSTWREAADVLGIDEPHTIDALEHWIVSDWFAEKLAEQGEIVGTLFDLNIWGRSTSGQAIAADGVIRQIASDMGILPGQPHAWETTDGEG
jgi:hypothetical protein